VKRAGEISYFIFRCIRRNGLNAVRRRIERKSRPAPTHLRLFDFLQNRKSSKSDQDSSSSDIRLSKNVSSFRGSFNRKPAHSRLRVFFISSRSRSQAGNVFIVQITDLWKKSSSGNSYPAGGIGVNSLAQPIAARPPPMSDSDMVFWSRSFVETLTLKC